MKFRFVLLLLPLASLLAVSSSGGYHLLKKIPVAGDGSWDYLAVDAGARRLYVSHGTQADVIDLDSEHVVGKITELKGVHGIAVAPKLGRGFVTSGLLNTVTIFDLKTLQHIGEVHAGNTPDGVLYESVTDRVFAFNKHGDSVTVFGAAEGKLAGTIELGGDPEFPVSDGKGSVWVNLEHKNTLVRIDARNLTLTGRWPTAPCEGPGPQAIDRKHSRLLIGCNSGIMAVVNPETGKIITTVPIGPHVDATAFDPASSLIFNANKGSVTIIHQDSPDKYSVVATVETEPGANTLALDPKTHKIYLSTADLGPPPEPTPETSNPRPSILPGTFKVLVLGE